MTIGWALVSPGAHAETLLAPAIGAAEGARLVAACSRDQERAEAFANRHGAQAAYASVEALVADARVDAVFIASPNFLHAPYTMIAARAGKHVLVEKPMAVTVEEAVEMVQACQADGVKLGVGFHLRHHPGLQEARRLLGEGVLGTITLAQAQWGIGLRGVADLSVERIMELRSGQRSAWWGEPDRIGSALAMMGQGAHCTDALHFLLDQRVVEVAALTDGQSQANPLERLATMCLRFDGGALATICCGFKIPDSKNDAAVYGSHGRIVLGDCLRTTFQGSLEVVSDTVNTVASYPSDPLALYKRQVESFNQAIEHDGQPLASGLDGLRVTQVTEAVIEAASTGRTVKITPLEMG